MLTREFDVVFYMVSTGAYTPEAYQNAYVVGVEHTLCALGDSTSRFIFVSSTSVFSENDGAFVDEQSPTDSSSFAKMALLKGEKLVSDSGREHIIVRLSGIYGPGRTQLIDSVRSGQAKLKRSSLISNRIHVVDCAGILHHLATFERPEQIYIGSDCEPTPYNEVLQWLADKIGKSPLELEDITTTNVHMSNKKCSNSKILSTGYQFSYPTFREGFMTCL
jgi:nucleoside-diphosphate-sugar epimerase